MVKVQSHSQWRIQAILCCAGVLIHLLYEAEPVFRLAIVSLSVQPFEYILEACKGYTVTSGKFRIC
jgi:hypothetical protein